MRNNNGVNNPPKKKSDWSAPKKKSDWSAPKTNSPELETFLSSVNRDLFCNTKPNDVKDNLSKEERSALKNWSKYVLFNKESELVVRLQDKGNRFVIVDKETGKIKAQQQKAKSSFQELDYDPAKEHIQKVGQWSQKWFRRKKFRKNGRII